MALTRALPAVTPRAARSRRALCADGAHGHDVRLAGDQVEAQDYSAYSDPEKPIVSFVLSDEQNVEEFQGEFSLSDEEVAEVLTFVRRENTTLAREYSESGQIVESGEELSAKEIGDKIDASHYDDRVRPPSPRRKPA